MDADMLDDDDYFHLACHVESTLKEKIQKGGEFIDLERLLLKQRPHRLDRDQLEWVSKDGLPYLAPVQDWESKITNVYKWEQALRVYATIFSETNTGRAGEIWKSFHIINSVTSTFQWDNVAYYDYTFRQMIHDRPNRKWSKTYLQLWQLAMHDPINKNFTGSHND